MQKMTSATVAWALVVSVTAGAVTIGGHAWAQALNEPAEGVSRVLNLDDDAHSGRIKSPSPRGAKYEFSEFDAITGRPGARRITVDQDLNQPDMARRRRGPGVK